MPESADATDTTDEAEIHFMSGSSIRRSRAAMLVTAGAIALSMVSAGGAQAAPGAPEKCTIKGFTPGQYIVNKTDTFREFKVQTRGCRQKNWRIELIGDTNEVLAFKAKPVTEVRPAKLDNAMAGTYEVLVTVKSTDNVTTKKKFPFSLVRRAAFGNTFSIGPEPASQGDTLNVVGKLQRVTWGENPSYEPYANRNVQVQFKAVGTRTFKKVKTVKTDADGDVITTVTATRSGTWRLRYAGNAATSAAVSKSNGIRLG
jgi:hypothetical protein